MNEKRIWLSSPNMGGDELKYINEAFDTNWIAPLGQNVDNFELEMLKYRLERNRMIEEVLVPFPFSLTF